MPNNQNLPIVVQSGNLLLETDKPLFEAARDALAGFAELEKSPEHFHYYRLTPLSLWNAASAGWTAEQIIQTLKTYSKYDIPQSVLVDIREYIGRYGRLQLAVRPERHGADSEGKRYRADCGNHAPRNRAAPYFRKKSIRHTVLLKDGARRGSQTRAH